MIKNRLTEQEILSFYLDLSKKASSIQYQLMGEMIEKGDPLIGTIIEKLTQRGGEGMGLKIHERTAKVEQAKIEIRTRLIHTQREFDLTDIEYLQVLTEEMFHVLKYQLRIERHGDENHPADEASDTHSSQS